MAGLSIDQSLRTAASDGALSLSILVNDHRDLAVTGAQSSVSGLLTAIRETPATYATLIEAAGAALTGQAESVRRLTEPPWTEASPDTRTAIQAPVHAAFDAQVAPVKTAATELAGEIGALLEEIPEPGASESAAAVKTLAEDLDEASDLLVIGLNHLELYHADSAATQFASSRSSAEAVLAEGEALLETLSAEEPPDDEQIERVEAIMELAESLLERLDRADALAASPLARVAGETPDTHELPSETAPSSFLTTWGTSGAVSITDDAGQGILIFPDGTVDPMPPGGDGWQFQTDSTFVLSDGTKISVSPGSPASVLATRGEQQITITPLGPGLTPSTERASAGGREADAARNDGYIFEMGADHRTWTLAGAALGDTPGSREVVASAPLENEVVIDVSKTDMPAALAAQLEAIGFAPAVFDTDGDGKLNVTEWVGLAATLDSAINAAKTQFDDSLARTAGALDALLRLNQFIAKILADADKRQSERHRITAAERDELLHIQRDIAASQNALRQATSPAPVARNVLGDARAVLKEIEALEPGSGAPIPTARNIRPAGERATQPNEPRPPTLEPAVDLARSSRRAERVLSGGLSSLRFVPPAQVSPTTPPTAGPSASPVAAHQPVPSSPAIPDGGFPAQAESPTRGSPVASEFRIPEATSAPGRDTGAPAGAPAAGTPPINPEPAGASSAPSIHLTDPTQIFPPPLEPLPVAAAPVPVGVAPVPVTPDDAPESRAIAPAETTPRQPGQPGSGPDVDVPLAAPIGESTAAGPSSPGVTRSPAMSLPNPVGATQTTVSERWIPPSFPTPTLPPAVPPQPPSSPLSGVVPIPEDQIPAIPTPASFAPTPDRPVTVPTPATNVRAPTAPPSPIASKAGPPVAPTAPDPLIAKRPPSIVPPSATGRSEQPPAVATPVTPSVTVRPSPGISIRADVPAPSPESAEPRVLAGSTAPFSFTPPAPPADFGEPTVGAASSPVLPMGESRAPAPPARPNSPLAPIAAPVARPATPPLDGGLSSLRFTESDAPPARPSVVSATAVGAPASPASSPPQTAKTAPVSASAGEPPVTQADRAQRPVVTNIRPGTPPPVAGPRDADPTPAPAPSPAGAGAPAPAPTLAAPPVTETPQPAQAPQIPVSTDPLQPGPAAFAPPAPQPPRAEAARGAFPTRLASTQDVAPKPAPAAAAGVPPPSPGIGRIPQPEAEEIQPQRRGLVSSTTPREGLIPPPSTSDGLVTTSAAARDVVTEDPAASPAAGERRASATPVSASAGRPIAAPKGLAASTPAPEAEFEPPLAADGLASTVSPAATRPRENVRAVVPSPTPAAPAAIGGLPILPGTGFAATGPDPFNDPDPTSGAAGGFKREFGRRMDQHRRVYHQQVDQLQHIHAEVRQVVERFMVLVGQDDQLRQVLASYDQSDTDRDVARENVASLERDLGISWGGDPDKGPRNEAALNARVLKSGMMI